MASLEVQYLIHGMTCGLLISGLHRFYAVIPGCSLPPPVLLARIWHEAAQSDEQAGCASSPR